MYKLNYTDARAAREAEYIKQQSKQSEDAISEITYPLVEDKDKQTTRKEAIDSLYRKYTQVKLNGVIPNRFYILYPLSIDYIAKVECPRELNKPSSEDDMIQIFTPAKITYKENKEKETITEKYIKINRLTTPIWYRSGYLGGRQRTHKIRK